MSGNASTAIGNLPILMEFIETDLRMNGFTDQLFDTSPENVIRKWIIVCEIRKAMMPTTGK